MQTAVKALLDLGPLPSSKDADPKKLEKFQETLEKVIVPITAEDAHALVSLFGPDDCFGIGWSLLHKIEEADGWPINDILHGINFEPSTLEWINRLNDRVQNNKFTM
jgi:hypothetical protein